MIRYKAEPRSRNTIRTLVYELRKKLGMENEINFPIARFVENGLPVIMPEFTLEIVPVEEMPDLEGETFPSGKYMRIREDVHEKACRGEGRSRLTLAHEVGHLFLHTEGSISFCRSTAIRKLAAYEDPEWQADCFGGELLAPSYLIRGMSYLEVSAECDVSYAAAQIQLWHANEDPFRIGA